MKLRDVSEFLNDLYGQWNEDKVPQLGAALAYYSVFSLAPLVILAIGIAGLMFNEQTARSGIVSEIHETVGDPAAGAIEKLITQPSRTGDNSLAAIVGLIVFLFGASGVFVQLQDSLNTIWKVTPRPGRAVWDVIRDRIIAFAIVMGTGFLVVLSLVVSAALAVLGEWVTTTALPGGVRVWQYAHAGISFALVTVLFALVFKLLPDARIAWRDVWMGAAVTALLFTLGKYLLGLYLGKSGLTSAFGAAGSFVLILVWVYYSTQILLLGAVFTRVCATRRGCQIVPADNAMHMPR